MSASAAIPTREGRLSVVQAELPGQGLVNLGVLLEDPSANALWLRFRRDLDSLVEDEEDLEVLSELADDLASESLGDWRRKAVGVPGIDAVGERAHHRSRVR